MNALELINAAFHTQLSMMGCNHESKEDLTDLEEAADWLRQIADGKVVLGVHNTYETWIPCLVA